ncbi:MAG: helix-turn-helix transcriptional regulator [Lentisphaeria bacterium]|nr:helix-turn-helix transcriptional regulator [Lentisphaeria bacterium]
MAIVKKYESTARLGEISIESQNHPTLTPASPFDMIVEYGSGPQPELKGDVHYCLQLSMVLAGSAEVVCGDSRRIYRKNEVWWTMCWEPHAFRLLSRRNVILTVNINIDTLGSVGPCSDADWLAPFTVAPEKRYCPKTPAEHQVMQSISRKLFHLNTVRPQNWKTHSWLLIHQLILQATEAIEKEPQNLMNNTSLNSDMSRIQQAVHLVRTKAIPPSLGEAAAACSLSVSRFSVLFSSVMGVSYGQFALRVRLSKAANDVKSGFFTLNEIAERHGFCDASSFCNAFKKIYRCTPNEFKLRR